MIREHAVLIGAIALGVVIVLGAIDLSCSAKPGDGSTIARVRRELSAGKDAARLRQVDELSRMARDMRVMARRHVKNGEMENARRAMASAQELDRKIKKIEAEAAK